MIALYFAVAIIVSYLIGAIPVGALVAATKRVDISKSGSGKTGATNVLRSVGRRAAALVLIGDMLKGAVAVVLIRLLAPLFITGDGHFLLLGYTVSILTAVSLVASAAVIAGHVWSIYLRLIYGKWHGGRGVSTAMGALLVVNPWVIIVALLVGIPVVVISRYVSLGSILGTASGALMVVLLVYLGQMDLLSLLFVSIAIFIIAAHRDNIERLMNGTERKLGDHAKT
ncbi:MAG: glycerol-3-phosphate 1-O-acyltransferase PlsY [Chloroflexota bacterium]